MGLESGDALRRSLRELTVRPGLSCCSFK